MAALVLPDDSLGAEFSRQIDRLAARERLAKSCGGRDALRGVAEDQIERGVDVVLAIEKVEAQQLAILRKFAPLMGYKP